MRKLHDNSVTKCREDRDTAVWAKYFAPECMAEIIKLNMDIVRWHDEMKNPIPIWYDKSLKYCNV